MRLLFDVQDRSLPHTVVDQATLARNLDMAEAGYRSALREARQYAEHAGAAFYHFLQPNLFTVHAKSAHESWLIENELKNLPRLDKAFALAYPRLRAAAEDACGPAAFDASDALDQRPPGEELYLDFCHVNHVANRQIARRIFAQVFGAAAFAKAMPIAVATDTNPKRQRGR